MLCEVWDSLWSPVFARDLHLSSVSFRLHILLTRQGRRLNTLFMECWWLRSFPAALVFPLREGASVLIHGTEGTDSTLQVTSLAQIILEPRSRTIRGFEALIEREWLQVRKLPDKNGAACC